MKNNFTREPIRSHVSGKRATKRKRPIALLIGIDVVAAALIMLLFFVTNYVMVAEISSQPLPTPSSHTNTATTTSTDSEATTDQTQTAGSDSTQTTKSVQTTDSTQTTEPALTTEPAQTTDSAQTTEPAQTTVLADSTAWRVKFADQFTDGAVETTANSYKSANISVQIDKVQEGGVTYFIADIYIADLAFFKSAFAKKPDVMGNREATVVVANENNAILAINGDHCVDNAGPVVRNGLLYRDQKYMDALVMNYDGSLQTFTADQLDMDKIKAEGAYQVWTFGPMLLDNGQPMTHFNSTLTGANPRTAVGYYEPGHYCFVVVDGRQPGYSTGYTLQEMSQLFYKLGCTAAFNLDGGQSSEMVFMGNIVNQPYNGGRSTTDILYIAAE